MAITATKTQQVPNETNKPMESQTSAHISMSSIQLPAKPSERIYHAKVKRTDLIMFTTELSVMLDSGVVLSDALDCFADQAENETFKTIILDVAEVVKSGENFSKALSSYPRVFNSMFISMVKASEHSGRMSEMLNVLSGYLNFEMETRKRIKGALTYPFMMAMMAVAATGTLMFFVLPRFMRIYETRGAALPKITLILVGFSKILGNFRLMTAIVTGIVLLSITLYYWSRTVTGRRAIDAIKIYTPVLGTMFRDMVVTRSMRIMATMINTGVKLLDSIQVVQGSCENYYFQQLWAGVNDKIRDGYQLSESLQITHGADLIAPGVIQMLRAGEKSGKLGEVCDKVSVFYEKKLEASIKSVMALIEPLMITILGVIIGTIVIALLLPVFRISSVIAH
ncbi:MAG: type II secretion system F family protein [Sedimentisphaerales bacterium]|jgi:type IV pilus assembly protein PilC|nr:type II secretion system F family protein [Sedimentisphaerales bacterium]